MASNLKDSGERWIDRMKAPYRLVIYNHDTFEEKGSYKLTLLNIYILLCTLMFIGALIVGLLLLFTPLKRIIPGYQDITHNTEFIQIERKLRNVEKELKQQLLYTEKLRNIITGEVSQNANDHKEMGPIAQPAANKEIERIPEDDQLRSMIEIEDRLTVKEKDDLLKKGFNKSLYQLYFIPPISGEISAGFELEKKHFGVDVLAPKNTPVKAVLDGIIISSDWTLETGHTIGIQHGDNLLSFYKHNSSNLKKVGDYVKAGEAVAIIGNSGTLSDGPHLHFELWHEGQPLDPSLFIKF